jgi:sugar lactone lactonase YvrE
LEAKNFNVASQQPLSEAKTMSQSQPVKHDGGAFSALPFRIVASWPAPSFLENVAVGPDGSLFVTVYSHNRIDRFDPKTGTARPFAELPARPMGLAFDASGSLWVPGSTMFEAPGYIWKVSAKGQVQLWTDLPEATFMNGCAIHPNGRELLACESRSNRILSIDLREPQKWSVWLEDDLIGPGDSRVPGANGIKVRGGHAYMTVSARHLIVRAPIRANGSPGPVETVFHDVLGDDFAFGESGTLYVTTHPAQSLVRIDPSGKRTTIGGPDQGMVGATACVFGTGPDDKNALYVSTDGGFIVPHEGVVQDAKLVRFEVGESGYRLLGER